MEQALSVSLTEYDAYGRDISLTPAPSAGSDFRFAGKHGYVFDKASGMEMLGARYYLPAVGRFLTQDPIGHGGGLNLYAYADNNPLNKVDPTGLQGENSNSWGRAWGFLGDFLTGGGKTQREYGPSDPETRDLIASRGGEQVRQQVLKQIAAGARGNSLRGYVKSLPAYGNTIMELGNGTQAQLGAFTWTGYYDPKNGYATVTITNKAGANSLLLHATDPFSTFISTIGAFSPLSYDGGFDTMDYDRTGNSKALGNIYQSFKFNVYVPKGK